jgi:hypothetical protein
MVNIQLGRPGAFNRIETCRVESAAATMTAEEKPPRSSCRMRKTCSRRGRRCTEDRRRSLAGSRDASVYHVTRTDFPDLHVSLEELYVARTATLKKKII